LGQYGPELDRECQLCLRNNQLFQFVFRLEPLSFREYAHGLGEVTGVMQGVGEL
jgi:ribosomal protein S14